MGRKQIIENLISKYKIADSWLADVCDLAAGTGSNLPLLTKIGKVTALEMDADSVRFLEDTWGDKVKVIQWKFPDSLDQKFDFFLFPVKLVFTWVVNLLKRLRLNNPDRSYNEVAVNPKMSMANELMKGISFFEAKLIPMISLPYGVSLIVILSKNT